MREIAARIVTRMQPTADTRDPASSLPPTGGEAMTRLRPRLMPHLPASVFILTTLLLPIGAINGQNNLLFIVFGLSVAALLISGVMGAWIVTSIAVHPEPIEPTEVGSVARVRYRLVNTSRVMPAFAIGVREFPRATRGRATPTWPGRLTIGQAFAEYIPPGGSVVVEAVGCGLVRGRATLDIVEVWTTFPFGLSRKTLLHGQPRSILIQPRSAAIRPDVLSSIWTRPDPRSMTAAARAGFGDEFFALREYHDGDSLRSVAWKRSAVVDRPLVRQNAASTGNRLWIALAGLERATPDETELAISAAAGVASAAIDRGYAVGIAPIGGRRAIAPRAGSRARSAALDAMGEIESNGAMRSSEAAPSRPGDAVVVVDARATSASTRGDGARVLPAAAILAETPRLSLQNSRGSDGWIRRLIRPAVESLRRVRLAMNARAGGEANAS